MAGNVASQDLRKHALEALERRCAAAKVELLQQQKKTGSTEKLKKEFKGKATLNDSSSTVVSGNHYDSSILLPSEGKPSNKGPLVVTMVLIFSFAGKAVCFSLLIS